MKNIFLILLFFWVTIFTPSVFAVRNNDVSKWAKCKRFFVVLVDCTGKNRVEVKLQTKEDLYKLKNSAIRAGAVGLFLTLLHRKGIAQAITRILSAKKQQ